jgi:hypothetical protein
LERGSLQGKKLGNKKARGSPKFIAREPGKDILESLSPAGESYKRKLEFWTPQRLIPIWKRLQESGAPILRNPAVDPDLE